MQAAPLPRRVPSAPPPWLIDRLRCPACDAASLRASGAAIVCDACRHVVSETRGVLDCLVDPHPAVRREAAAVRAIDRGEASLEPDSVAEDGAKANVDADAAARAHIDSTLRQIDRLLAEHPLPPKGVLVELGADHCQASPRFLEAGLRVLSVDITDHLETPWREATAPECEPECEPEAALRHVRLRCDMNRLPLRDATVDAVWATAAAHHSWDLAATFREAARVLRPGGRLTFCCEPMPGPLRWRLERDVGAAERALGINETWIPRRRWLALAREAGFSARIEVPPLTAEEVARRLSSRGVPRWLVPVARPLLRPVLGRLQVSVHLLGARQPSGLARGAEGGAARWDSDPA